MEVSGTVPKDSSDSLERISRDFPECSLGFHCGLSLQTLSAFRGTRALRDPLKEQVGSRDRHATVRNPFGTFLGWWEVMSSWIHPMICP